MTLCMFLAFIVPSADPVASGLKQVADVEWREQPVQEIVQSLARNHKLRIFQDDRVDLSGTTSGSYKRWPVERILSELARYSQGEAVELGDLVFLGPKDSADRAATLHAPAREKLDRAAGPLAGKLLARRALSWKETMAVFDIVQPIAEELGLTLEGGDSLDARLAAGSTKEAPLIDLLAALFACCDHGWSLDPERNVLKAIELPEDAELERRIRAPKTRAKDYAGGRLPVAVTTKGSDIVLRGSWAALREAEWLAADKRAAPIHVGKKIPGGKKKIVTETVYNMKLSNVTLERFAAELAKVTGRSFALDQDSFERTGRSKLDRINCLAAGLPLDELLSLALKPAGFGWTKKGSAYTIHGADDDKKKPSPR